MFGHLNLLKDGAQIDGVVLRNDTPNNITKDRLLVGVKFDDGQTAEFTEDVTNYYEPPAHSLAEFAHHLSSNNVVPLMLTPGDKVPVRYNPDDRSRLAIDVPALQEQALRDWTERQQAERARAESVLAAQGSAGRSPQAELGARIARDDAVADQVEALTKLAELHQSGSLSDDEFAAAKRKLLSE